MRFEIAHEFEIPLDALELAVVSPALVGRLEPHLRARSVGIEKVDAQRHDLRDGKLDRVWHYRAHVPLPAAAHAYVARDLWAWDEHATYDMRRHEGRWDIAPVLGAGRSLVSASGTYRVEALGGGRSRRVVRGEIALRLRVVGPVAERWLVAEVRRAFEAEAETLREMATLL